MRLQTRLAKLESQSASGRAPYVVRLTLDEWRLPQANRQQLIRDRSGAARRVAVLPAPLSMSDWRNEMQRAFK